MGSVPAKRGENIVSGVNGDNASDVDEESLALELCVPYDPAGWDSEELLDAEEGAGEGEGLVSGEFVFDLGFEVKFRGAVYSCVSVSASAHFSDAIDHVNCSFGTHHGENDERVDGVALALTCAATSCLRHVLGDHWHDLDCTS